MHTAPNPREHKYVQWCEDRSVACPLISESPTMGFHYFQATAAISVAMFSVLNVSPNPIDLYLRHFEVPFFNASPVAAAGDFWLSSTGQSMLAPSQPKLVSSHVQTKISSINSVFTSTWKLPTSTPLRLFTKWIHHLAPTETTWMACGSLCHGMPLQAMASLCIVGFKPSIPRFPMTQIVVHTIQSFISCMFDY